MIPRPPTPRKELLAFCRTTGLVKPIVIVHLRFKKNTILSFTAYISELGQNYEGMFIATCSANGNFTVTFDQGDVCVADHDIYIFGG